MEKKNRIIRGPLPAPFKAGQVWFFVPDDYQQPDPVPGVKSLYHVDLFYVNKLCSLNEEVLKYNVPSYKGGFSSIDMLDRMRCQLSDIICADIIFPTFIRFIKQGGDFSVEITEYPDSYAEPDLIRHYLESLPPAQPRRKREAGAVPEYIPEVSFRVVNMSSLGLDEFKVSKEMASIAPAPAPKEEVSEEEKRENDIIRTLKRSNSDKLRELGFTSEQLQYIYGWTPANLSHLVVTRHGEIVLEDYNMRIELAGVTKALYLLYLRHPEGIAIKDLSDHARELMDLYQSVSGRDDPEAMRRTIDKLCDPFENEANVHLSRIKHAFVKAVNDDIAKEYYVAGTRGGIRRIALDPSLIRFETIR